MSPPDARRDDTDSLAVPPGTSAQPRALIAIVDDDEAVRLSTAKFLETAGFDVRMFRSGDDFLSSTTSDAIGCILLDMNMPGASGLDVLATLRKRGQSPPVIVVTGHGEVSLAVEAMRLGAHDFMEKPYESDALRAAIDIAVATRHEATDAWTTEVDAKALVATLAPRQRQVLQGMFHGQPNKIIAYELGLSIRTIEAYRAQLMTKLGVLGTAGAVRIAVAAGLPEPAPN